jgi:hypothetical protein|eukprot:COSAG06_NODE_835_length_12032_cov_5.757060_5_plen_59_part_00
MIAPAAAVAWEATLQAREHVSNRAMAKEKAKAAADEAGQEAVSDEFLTHMKFVNPISK